MDADEAPASPRTEDVGCPPANCPFCGATDTELVSLFGSQLLVSQLRCRACRSYFEAVRDDRWSE